MEKVIIRGAYIYVYFSYNERHLARDAGGQWWDPFKRWRWPIEAKSRLFNFFPEFEKIVNEQIKAYKKAVNIMIKNKQENFERLQIDISQFKRKPMAHQVDMIKKMILEKKFALLCDPGTGKSQAVINSFQLLHEDKLVKKCLIICPYTLLDNWQHEIKKCSDLSSIIVYGSKKKREELISRNYHFYIINYAGLRILKKYSHWHDFDMVVVDESHNFKDEEALQTEIILKNFENTPYKYILTGSVISQSPLDLYSQFKFLDPIYFSCYSFWEFKQKYCVLEKGEVWDYKKKKMRAYYTIKAFRNLHELKQKLMIHSLQLKREDCVDLPDKIYQTRSLTLSPEIKKEYKNMAENFYSEVAGLSAKLIIEKLMRMQQILSGSYLQDNNQNPKLKELLKLVKENLYGKNQIVIWCRFRKSIEMIKEALNNLDIEVSELHGGIKDRSEEIRKFETGKTKIIIGTPQAGGVGINLIAGNIVVYFENDYKYAVRMQSEDRCHRIGQTKKVLYIDLLYKNTIDIDIYKVLKRKGNIAQYMSKRKDKKKYKNMNIQILT
ncbi:MAG: DEAD/DEAH box helicase [Promethearchaeota archaeon]|jgi:SNF2 family DNA or RNA helicase